MNDARGGFAMNGKLTATVPFDDRQCRQADVDDLRPGLLQSYLKEIGSNGVERLSAAPLLDG